MNNLVWLDVDTQADFVSPRGAFGEQVSAWHIERIVPNLGRLARYAEGARLTTILATDAHVPDDPEFSDTIPPHCVLGTPGHERIPETDLAPTLVVANRPGDFVGPLPDAERQVIRVHKQHFAVGSNPNFAALVDAIGPDHVVVTGVATQGCVIESVKSLLGLGIPVSVVVDGVGPDIHEEPGRRAIDEMRALGVGTVTTDEVCAGALGPDSFGSGLLRPV